MRCFIRGWDWELPNSGMLEGLKDEPPIPNPPGLNPHSHTICPNKAILYTHF